MSSFAGMEGSMEALQAIHPSQLSIGSHDRLGQLSRVWFLTDYVKLCEVEALYRAGHDDLAAENRTCITDIAALR